MRVKQIIFKDFRQFHGEQALHFSHDTKKNVTIVFGTNGAGKTTILNAVQWVLYGEFSKDFEEPEVLVNSGVMSAAGEGVIVEAYVELQFEHAKKNYVMRRTVYAVLNHGIQEISNIAVSLYVTDESGANHFVPEPKYLITNMFPDRLAKFYFFNGERLESNASRGFKNLADEIKIVMGLVKYERAIKRLPKVRDLYTSELASLSDDKELNKLGDQAKDISKKLEAEDEKYLKAEAEHQLLSEKIDAVQEVLRNHDRSQDLQKQRDQFKEDSSRAFTRQKNAHRDLLKLLNQSSAVPFMGEMSELTIANSEDLRVRGELPRAIKVQFIDDLLGEGACICGTPLSEGSHEHTKVSEWRLKAGHAESEEAWIKSAAYARVIPNAIEGFTESLRDYLDRIRLAKQEKLVADENSASIAKQLKDIDLEEVQKLELEYERLSSERDQALITSALASKQREIYANQLREVQAQIAKATANDQQAQLVNRRITAIDEAIVLLQKELDIRTELVRSHLEAGISETYNGIVNHEFIPHMDKKFSLTLKRSVGGQIITAAKSTAETHSLYLTFIAQLSKQNRELNRTSDAGGIGVHEQFPIIMDAAFGNFDTEPKRRLVNALPDLSHQIIILVSKDQGVGVVEDSLQERCGKKAVLTLHAVKPNLEEEKISVNNQEFDYVVSSDTYDYSIIKEVN